MPPTPASGNRRWITITAFLIVAAALAWLGVTVTPSIKRSVAASELRSLGFEAGVAGNPGKQSWRSWLDGMWQRWRKGPDPKAAEWTDRVRLMSSRANTLNPYASALSKFQPKEVLLGFCGNLSDVSALRSFRALERLDFYECPKVTDFTIVSQFPQLRKLTFHESPALKNLDCIRSATHLDSLHISKCPELSDFDGLQACKNLQSLWLSGCARLHTAESLRELSQLEDLNLSGCSGLVDVTALHGLKRLKVVRLDGCPIPSDAIAALRAALPGTTVSRRSA